jgi:phage tail sheath protein FI
MVAATYPGVYIQEVSSGVRTITGVSTSTAMFIGRTERGVMDKPTRVFNYSEFSRKFGTSTSASELATAVRLFFANGGTQAYVMRIAKNATKASVTLKDITGTDDVLTLTAREAGGRGGELRVAVDYNTPTPDSTFNLRVFRVDPTSLQESELEVHSNLTMEADTARYVVDILAQDSALVTATNEIGPSAEDGYSMGSRVITGDAEADLALIIPNGSKLRLEVDGVIVVPDPTIEAGIISTELPVGCTFSLVPVEAALTSLVKITKTGGTVRVLQSGATSDVATLLQMGPALGGIEFTSHASQRPAPSGVFAGGYTNLGDIAAFDQATYNSFGITVAGTALTGFNLEVTGAEQFYKGKASAFDSLLNVREKLNILASQFNAKAQAISNFHWRLEVQGLYLVFRPTVGVANQGVATVITATDADFFHAANGIDLPDANARSYTVGAGGAGGFQNLGVAGLEGDAPEITHYAAAYDIIDREVDIFNLLILPRDADIDDPVRKDFWGPASAFCQKRRAFLLVDPPKTWTSTADITGATISINTLRQGLVKDHSGVYWPRVLAPNEHGLIKPVDPSGAVAGVMARIDASRGVFKAPAGIEADIRAISGVERQVSDPENGVTNALAVNTIRVFPNGIVSWGARTMDGFDNSGNDDYKYVPVRRLALLLAESLQRGLKFAVFEPNDEPLWAQIRLAAGSFMNGLFRQGAFQGQKKSDAYFVKVDAETTTQNDINLGIVNVIVGFAPLKPAEFVVVQIQQLAGQIQT